LAEDVSSVSGNLTLFGGAFSTTTLVLIGIGACIVWRVRKKGGPILLIVQFLLQLLHKSY